MSLPRPEDCYREKAYPSYGDKESLEKKENHFIGSGWNLQMRDGWQIELW